MTDCGICPHREDGPLARLSGKGTGLIDQVCRTREFGPGEVIFLQGSPANEFYFLCGGTVKLIRESLEGKRTIVEIVVPCGWFGEFSFHDGGVQSVTAEVLEKATVNILTRNVMADILHEEPALLDEMVNSLNRSLRNARIRNADYNHLPVRLRVLHLLTTLFERYGRNVSGSWEIGIPLARSEMAEMLGTTTETAIRTLSQLQREGHLRLGRRRIQIRDPEALELLFENESHDFANGEHLRIQAD